MTAVNIEEEIQHLDFTVPEESKAPDCDGWVLVGHISRKLREDSSGTCAGKAIFYCFRACCGVVEQLCIPCYNRNVTTDRFIWCKFGTKSGNKHIMSNPKYSQVERI
jgi:hypothetical protein